MISYETFWLTLTCKDISTYTLINKHGISSNTLNRMKHGKPITTGTINKLCKAMDCGVDDVIEFVRDEPPCQQIDNSGKSLKS